MFFEQAGRHGSSEFQMFSDPVEDRQERKEKEPSDYLQMIESLKDAIEAYFPEDASQFDPPTYSRFLESFESSLHNIQNRIGIAGDIQVSQQDRAFIAAAAIRYVDDFLDETLWSRRTEYTPEVFEKLVKGFLERSYAIANVYDPTLPHDIIKLPLLELDLELHPTQENFDKQIQSLFHQKSYDMAYVAHRFFDKQGEKIFNTTKQEDYMGIAIGDYARDFNSTALEKDKDFNVFRYVREYNLNTFMLERLVLTYDAQMGKRAKSLMNGDQPFDADDLYVFNAQNGASEHFYRGMTILSALWRWQHKQERKPWEQEEGDASGSDYDYGDLY